MSRKRYLFLLLAVANITLQVSSQTLVPFRYKDGQYTYADSATGKILLPQIRAAKCGFFNKQGYALIKTINQVFSIIDKNGRVKYSKEYTNENLLNIEELYNKDKTDFIFVIDYRDVSYINYKKILKFNNSVFTYRNIEINKNSDYWCEIKNFNEGIFSFSKKENNIPKWGFIDVEGVKLVDALYDDTYSFNNGRAGVKTPIGWGYIDNSGTEIIPTKYKEIRDFQDECALVLDKKGDLLFINTDGSKIILVSKEITNIPDPILVSNYTNGWALIDYDNSTGKTMIANKKGITKSITLPKMFTEPLFIDGFFFCKKEYQTTASLLDLNGKTIIPFNKYKSLRQPSNDLLAFETNGAWGFVDINGKELIKAGFYETGDFFQGTAKVKSLKGWSFIDKKGETIFTLKNHPDGEPSSYEIRENGFIRHFVENYPFSSIYISLNGIRFYEE